MSISQKTTNVLRVAMADAAAADEIVAAVNTITTEEAGEAEEQATLPQNLASTDSPTFAGLTLTGDVTAGGHVKLATSKVVKVNNVQVVGGQGTAIASLTVTYTTGDPSITPGNSVTIANGATPTVAELLTLCVNLDAKITAVLGALRTHGLIAT